MTDNEKKMIVDKFGEIPYDMLGLVYLFSHDERREGIMYETLTSMFGDNCTTLFIDIGKAGKDFEFANFLKSKMDEYERKKTKNRKYQFKFRYKCVCT